MQDTHAPSKIKKTKDVQDVSSSLVNTASRSPEQGGDGEDVDGTQVE
jgi:hypothetical protein